MKKILITSLLLFWSTLVISQEYIKNKAGTYQAIIIKTSDQMIDEYSNLKRQLQRWKDEQNMQVELTNQKMADLEALMAQYPSELTNPPPPPVVEQPITTKSVMTPMVAVELPVTSTQNLNWTDTDLKNP